MYIENELFLIIRGGQKGFAIFDSLDRHPDDRENLFHEPKLQVYLDRKEFGPMGDFPYVTGDYVFSDRAKAIITSCKCHPRNRWVTIEPLNKPLDGKYWRFSFPRQISIFDSEHSEYDTLGNSYLKGDIRKWVVKHEKLQELDFIYANSDFFASAKLKELIEENDLKGFQFRPVLIWKNEEED